MEKFLVYIIFPFICIAYLYFIIKSNFLIIELKNKMSIPRHWSGRIGVKELIVAYNNTNDEVLKTKLKRTIYLLKFGKISVYVGFALIVVIMIFFR